MTKKILGKEPDDLGASRRAALALWSETVQAVERQRKDVRAIWNDALCSGSLSRAKEILEYQRLAPEEIEHDAKKGNIVARFVYGIALIDGEKFPVDERRGMSFVLDSAEGGMAEAQIYMALRCLRNASEQGCLLPAAMLAAFDEWVDDGRNPFEREEPRLPENPRRTAAPDGPRR